MSQSEFHSVPKSHVSDSPRIIGQRVDLPGRGIQQHNVNRSIAYTVYEAGIYFNLHTRNKEEDGEWSLLCN